MPKTDQFIKKLQEFDRRLEDCTSIWWFRSSDNYRAMHRTVKEFLRRLEALQDTGCSEEELLSEVAGWSQKLLQATQVYLEGKKDPKRPDPYVDMDNEYTCNRIKAAEALRRYVKVRSEKASRIRADVLFAEYKHRLEEIRVVAPGCLAGSEDDEYTALPRYKQYMIEQYTKEKYPHDPQKRKEEYARLCQVSEALHQEELVRRKNMRIRKANQANKEAGNGVPEQPKITLDEKYAKILQEWRKPLDDEDGFAPGDYRDQEINNQDRDIIHATIAYQEKRFDAIKIMRENAWRLRMLNPGEQEFTFSAGQYMGKALMVTGYDRIYFAQERFDSSCDFSELSECMHGYHSGVGEDIPAVAGIPAHEYGHACACAITWLLYDKLYPEEKGRQADAQKYTELFGYINCELRQIILKKAEEKLGRVPGDKRRAKAGEAFEGISGYGAENPYEFIAEVFVHVTHTEDGERNTLGQVLDELFQDGLEGVARELSDSLRRESLRREKYEAYQRYFKLGFTGKLKRKLLKRGLTDWMPIYRAPKVIFRPVEDKVKELLSCLPPEQAGEAEHITKQNKRRVKKAILDEFVSVMNNAMDLDTVTKAQQELLGQLDNLIQIIRSGEYEGRLGRAKDEIRDNPYNGSSFKNAFMRLLSQCKPSQLVKLPMLQSVIVPTKNHVPTVMNSNVLLSCGKNP